MNQPVIAALAAALDAFSAALTKPLEERIKALEEREPSGVSDSDVDHISDKVVDRMRNLIDDKIEAYDPTEHHSFDDAVDDLIRAHLDDSNNVRNAINNALENATVSISV